jgi:hypothetical protein
VADRSVAAIFEPPPGNLGELDTKLVVYEDGGVEIHGATERRILLTWPMRLDGTEEPEPFEFNSWRPSWFDSASYDGWHMAAAPRLCPGHLPVFGVVEESENG